MTRQLYRALLLLLFGVLWGCSGGGSPTEPPNRATFRGGVHIVQTETPVPGVTVSVQSRTTMTGDDGMFSIGDLTPGPATVALRKTGYVPADLQLTLMPGDNVFSLGMTPE